MWFSNSTIPPDRYPFCRLTFRGKKPMIEIPRESVQATQEIDVTSLGGLIAKRRAELGQTLKEASREIGISFHTFFKWEHGIRTPHSPLYSKIISYLGYDPWREADLTFGNLLHQARLRLGLTRTSLSERLGICRGAYARWEDDKITRPCMKERRMLEKFLKRGLPAEEESATIPVTPQAPKLGRR